LQVALALERDAGARNPQAARRQAAPSAPAADARRGSARGGLPGPGHVPGAHERTDSDPGSSAGPRDDARLPARGDGSRSAPRGARPYPASRDPVARAGAAGAVAALARDP